jgi:hypothetical protein
MKIVTYEHAPKMGACSYEYKPNSVKNPGVPVWSFTLAFCCQNAHAALSPYVSYTQKYREHGLAHK